MQYGSTHLPLVLFYLAVLGGFWTLDKINSCMHFHVIDVTTLMQWGCPTPVS